MDSHEVHVCMTIYLSSSEREPGDGEAYDDFDEEEDDMIDGIEDDELEGGDDGKSSTPRDVLDFPDPVPQ